MKPNLWSCAAVLALVTSCGPREANEAGRAKAGPVREYAVTGVVQRLDPGKAEAVVRHQKVPGYMSAMTMPFRVRDTNELAEVQPGDELVFRLNVAEDESWIDRIKKTGARQTVVSGIAGPDRATTNSTGLGARHPLLEFAFTNELDQPVRLGQFAAQGKALAYTFIFTRCPVPDYCPRLTKNFAGVSRKLAATPNAPANWHLLSVTIDPEFDTPAVLRAYARNHGYDSNHWSFVTGPTNVIRQLAEMSGLAYERDVSFGFTHGLRTLIVDRAGRLQQVIPVGGDLSDVIADELIKAATAPTNAVR
jgi:protein SCO1/2